MATPPFQPDETAPAPSDLISAYPVTEQTFRDIIESWLLTISTENGVLKASAFPSTVSVGNTLQVGTDYGSPSNILGFFDNFRVLTDAGTAVVLETTDANATVGILFAVGATAYGQIRYLHASEAMQFYTDNTLQATLGSTGTLTLANSIRTGSGSTGVPTQSWSDDSNTGWWNDVNVSQTWCLNGTDRVKFNADGITMLVSGDGFHAFGGSAAVPIITVDSDQDTGFYEFGTDTIGISVGGTNVGRISSGGTARFGPASYTNDASAGVAISGAGASGGAGGISATRNGFACVYLNRLSSNGNIIEFSRQNNFIAAISITTSAVTYNTTSDARHKENARDFDSGALVDAIPMHEFDWLNGAGSGYGALVNAEVAARMPTAFTYDESNDLWMADYSKFTPVLWREVQCLRKRVTELENTNGTT